MMSHVATATAGHQDLHPDRSSAIEDQYLRARPTRMDGGEQSGGTGTDDDDIGFEEHVWLGVHHGGYGPGNSMECSVLQYMC